MVGGVVFVEEGAGAKEAVLVAHSHCRSEEGRHRRVHRTGESGADAFHVRGAHRAPHARGRDPRGASKRVVLVPVRVEQSAHRGLPVPALCADVAGGGVVEGVAAHPCRDERESDRCPRRRGGGGRRREREDGRRHAGSKKGCVRVCAHACFSRSDSGEEGVSSVAERVCWGCVGGRLRVPACAQI